MDDKCSRLPPSLYWKWSEQSPRDLENRIFHPVNDHPDALSSGVFRRMAHKVVCDTMEALSREQVAFLYATTWTGQMFAHPPVIPDNFLYSYGLQSYCWHSNANLFSSTLLSPWISILGLRINAPTRGKSHRLSGAIPGFTSSLILAIRTISTNTATSKDYFPCHRAIFY